MDNFDVNVDKRINLGKSTIRKLKDEGLIPGVLYGKEENIPISLEINEIKYILDKHGKDIFISLNLEGRQIKVKIQEIQRDPITQEIKHIDFMPVDDRILH